MYNKTKRAALKSIYRAKLLRLRKHFDRFVKGAVGYAYIRAAYGWGGVVEKSTLRECHRRNRSKYKPHQGKQECLRRTKRDDYESYMSECLSGDGLQSRNDCREDYKLYKENGNVRDAAHDNA